MSKELSKEKIFYVYAWYIIETKQIFYIGKGSNGRYKNKSKSNRSSDFVSFCKEHNCKSIKLKENLDEATAFEEEEKFILQYKTCHPDNILVNKTNGGVRDAGWIAPQWYRDKMREKCMGENNPNYNNRWNQEQKDHLRSIIQDSGRYKGEKNPKATPVMCLETGEFFTYIQEAMEAYNIDGNSSLSIVFREPQRTAGGMHWIKIDDENENLLQDKEARFKKLLEYMSLNRDNSVSYISILTKRIFKTKKELSEFIGIKSNEVNIYLKFDKEYMTVNEYYGRTYQ